MSMQDPPAWWSQGRFSIFDFPFFFWLVLFFYEVLTPYSNIETKIA